MRHNNPSATSSDGSHGRLRGSLLLYAAVQTLPYLPYRLSCRTDSAVPCRTDCTQPYRLCRTLPYTVSGPCHTVSGPCRTSLSVLPLRTPSVYFSVCTPTVLHPWYTDQRQPGPPTDLPYRPEQAPVRYLPYTAVLLCFSAVLRRSAVNARLFLMAKSIRGSRTGYRPGTDMSNMVIPGGYPCGTPPVGVPYLHVGGTARAAVPSVTPLDMRNK